MGNGVDYSLGPANVPDVRLRPVPSVDIGPTEFINKPKNGLFSNLLFSHNVKCVT